MKSLFLGKRSDPFTEQALSLWRERFPETQSFLGLRPEPFPAEANDWEGELIVSYLSPWIVPESLLHRAKQAAINFHPGPPEYPGIGCTNFAIYHEVRRYGATCHHMERQVDTGEIIAVKRFPLLPTDSVWDLTQRTYRHLFELFDEISRTLHVHRVLPTCREKWQRQPYRRAELNELCKLTPEMDQKEIERRVRAVTYPGMPGAYFTQ